MAFDRKKRLYSHCIVLTLWIGPGGFLCWKLQHSIAWLVFMSWLTQGYAIVAAISGETKE